MNMSTKSNRWKSYVAGGALVIGAATGAAVTANLVANADTTGSTTTGSTTGSTAGSTASAADTTSSSTTDTSTPTSTDTSATDGTADSTRPQRSSETALTGDTATKVTAAALAAYPGAAVDRVETDSDGVYEAHLTTAAGDKLIVQIGADFTVTGTQTGGGHGGGHGGGRGGHGAGGKGHGGSGETALTGDTATKVTDAATAAYPGATINRVETDSDGVYEAHLTTAAGDKVTVEIGADFTVTGTESH